MDMDVVLEHFENGHVIAGMCRMHLILKQRKRSLADDEWRQYVAELNRHPLLDVLRTDPFTRRAYVKPRGYAGDAVMMDYIYGYGAAEIAALPPAPRKVFEYCTGTAAPLAVRFRRQLLAETIDAVADSLDRPADVIALAAGHLREADLSSAVRSGRAHVIAIDQDDESLGVIRRDYGQYGVRTQMGSVRRIIGGAVPLAPCDLAYSAGLFDYLPTAAATRLTSILFDALRPGGRLLLANFLPDIMDLGYMDSVMDWQLIYRTDDAMRALLAEINPASLGSLHQFHDPLENITFLTVTKGG